MADITIVTVNWHSGVWIRRLLENLLRKSSGRNSLQAMILDNTGGADTDLAGVEPSGIPCRVQPINPQGLTGSRGHAFALNEAMRIVQTEFVLVVDPDVHVFASLWDSLCIDTLSAKNAWAIGAPYPHWKVGKYHDFPSPVFCLFRRELLHQIPMDWRPYYNCLWCNAGVFVVRQIGRLGGLLNRRLFEQSTTARSYARFAEGCLGTFSQDTGWRNAHASRQQKLVSIVFDDILPQDAGNLDVPVDSVWIDLAREFELFAWANRPMMVHRYGTGGRPWRTAKGNDESFWLQCVDKVEALLSRANPKTEA